MRHNLQCVVVGSYVIDNVLAVPAVHQQLVHDQQEQDEKLEVVVDIDTLQHRQTDRIIRESAGDCGRQRPQEVNLEQPFVCAPRRADASGVPSGGVWGVQTPTEIPKISVKSSIA